MRYFSLCILVLLIAGCEISPSAPPASKTVAVGANYAAANWMDLPAWPGEQLLDSWPAWLQSCTRIGAQPQWKAVCAEARNLNPRDSMSVRQYFERNFQPWRIDNRSGEASGLVTGYYDILLKGSRVYKKGYTPIYAVPDDLLTIELGDLYPELKNQRVRGRLQGRKVVPYWDRRAIDSGAAPLEKKIIAYAADPLDAFFLQVQGSGRLLLDDGSVLRLNYADQNGQPYRSIGKWLVDQGELPLPQVSMQSIRAWAQAHPERVREMLDSNPSFVFFKAVPADSGAQGALGVALSAGRSVAVDTQFIALGTPLYLTTTSNDSTPALQRLVHAQDTGGAIRGPLRVDYFCGSDNAAAELAGLMKQRGQLWLLWPKGFEPAQPQ